MPARQVLHPSLDLSTSHGILWGMSHERVSRIPREKKQLTDADVDNAIPEIRSPLKNLLTQLHQPIEDGKIDIIASEGSSSLLPAYILGRAIGDIYKMKGRKYPLFISLKGMQHVFDPQEYDFRNRKVKNILREHSSKNALIITDTVIYGGSAYNAVRFLKENGNIHSDIATVTKANATTYALPEDTNIYVGSYMESLEDDLIIYGRHEFTGRKRIGISTDKQISVDDRTKDVMARVWPQAQALRKELVEEFMSRRSNT
jgi:hypothetical protein